MTVRYITDGDAPRRTVLTAFAEEYELATQTTLKAILSLRFLALSLPIAILAFAEAVVGSPALKSPVLLFAASLLVVLALIVAWIERQPGRPVLHHFNEEGRSVWRWAFQSPEPRYSKTS